MVENIIIDKLTEQSWIDVARIYESAIATKNVTFHTCAPSWDEWDKSHRQDCRLIAKIDNKIVGWSALSYVSSRSVYSGVAEVSVYVDSDFRGKGVGDKLMSSLISDSEKQGIWTLQAAIFPENIGSIKLHLKHGFRIIGIKERIGKMDNEWRDLTMVERRSNVVGID